MGAQIVRIDPLAHIHSHNRPPILNSAIHVVIRKEQSRKTLGFLSSWPAPRHQNWPEVCEQASIERHLYRGAVDSQRVSTT